MKKHINAGKYDKKIKIYSTEIITDAKGFQRKERCLVLETYANVRTTRGMTLIKNGSDFEKVFTNFTIRYPVTPLNRDMEIEFRGKFYVIEYLSNIDEANVEIEIQAREVTH